MKKSITSLLVFGLWTTSLVPAQAALFTENFNDGLGATRWGTSSTGTTVNSNFAFDYSTVGIAAAPGGTGTVGLLFDASSSTAGVLPGIIALPNGQSFSGDYVLSFSMYLAFTTGNTTEYGYFGINHSSSAITPPTAGSTTVAAVGLSNNGFDFAIDGDGGSSKDIRAYASGAEFQGTAGGGGYAGTTGLGTALGMEANQAPYTNVAANGVFGNRWREVVISQLGSSLTWNIDGQLIAQRTVVPGSGNILLGYTDLFSGQPSAVDTYVIYDNISVVPEPSVSLMALGAVLLPLRRRRA